MWMMRMACAVAAAAGTAVAEWRPAWGDEFDRNGRPDPGRWSYEVGAIRNREAQYYTRDRAENARVENGRLVIEARREPMGGKEWTSASLITRGLMHARFARVEIRARLPEGRGVWPALWSMGVHEPPLPWPRCGEIDIMEMVGYEPDVIHTTVHTGKYNHRQKNQKGAKFNIPGASRDFHIYAVEVLPDAVRFQVDGVERFAYVKEEGAGIDAWPFDAPQYLLVNLAIGGTWGGARGIDEAMSRARMEVDYVRVFTNSAIRGSGVILPSAADLKPGAN